MESASLELHDLSPNLNGAAHNLRSSSSQPARVSRGKYPHFGLKSLLCPCRVCKNRHGLIRKYHLNVCRQCFRQYANDIGFYKYR